jgi:phosphate/sulfate permease
VFKDATLLGGAPPAVDQEFDPFGAELVAAATIVGADALHLPVSTTHVFSSGVAGRMAANGSGVQGETVRKIFLAWVLTLPASTFLAGLLFAAGRPFVGRARRSL